MAKPKDPETNEAFNANQTPADRSGDQASGDARPAMSTGPDPARTGSVDRTVETVPTATPEVQDAMAKANEANARAAEARAKAANAGRSPEELAADKAEREADDARAAAAETAQRARGPVKATTVAEAKNAAAPLVGANMSAGEHAAQKFGNDPENPKPAPGLNPNAGTVRMSRKTPDHPDLVYADVHPEMVGDYMRAGWNKA
jgi:hypothetical protein